MRSRIVSVFSDALASAKIPVLDLATRYTELGDALLPVINPVVAAKYGIEITSFILENARVPPEVEAAIDKRSSMSAVGNLNDYVKFQMAQGMASRAAAARRRGRGDGDGLRHGAADDEAAGRGSWRGRRRRRSAGAGRAAAGARRADARRRRQDARRHRADVIASIEAGDLKGKKIGTQYRVTKAALDEFLKH